jgi:hypothetical protein
MAHKKEENFPLCCKLVLSEAKVKKKSRITFIEIVQSGVLPYRSLETLRI